MYTTFSFLLLHSSPPPPKYPTIQENRSPPPTSFPCSLRRIDTFIGSHFKNLLYTILAKFQRRYTRRRNLHDVTRLLVIGDNGEIIDANDGVSKTILPIFSKTLENEFRGGEEAARERLLVSCCTFPRD